MGRVAIVLTAAVGALVLGFAAVMIGAVPTNPSDVFDALIQLLTPSNQEVLGSGTGTIIAEIRLPRVVFGLVSGAILAVCGAILQGLFHNDLADPGLLGVSSGAAFAVGLAVVLFPNWRVWAGVWALPTAAFVGSLAAAAIVWGLAKVLKDRGPAGLVLAGVAVTALGGAGTGLLLAIAQDAQLRDLTFWSLGSLGGVTWTNFGAALPWLLLPLPFLPWMSRHLDALLLGGREAQSLGTPVRRLETLALFLVAGSVGAVTALAGTLGFVGLVAPHLARLWGGSAHRIQLPLAACLGAALTVSADALARTLVVPSELPLGVVLGFVGAPFLLWLLAKKGARS